MTKKKLVALTLILLSCLTACGPNNNPEPQTEDFSKTFAGELYTYYRDYAPQSRTVVEQRDTYSISLTVIRQGDSLRFMPSDGTLMPSCTFKVNDSIGVDNYYRLFTYRPMESYQIKGDTAMYSYSITDPGAGPYLVTKFFTGIRQQ